MTYERSFLYTAILACVSFTLLGCNETSSTKYAAPSSASSIGLHSDLIPAGVDVNAPPTQSEPSYTSEQKTPINQNPVQSAAPVIKQPVIKQADTEIKKDTQTKPATTKVAKATLSPSQYPKPIRYITRFETRDSIITWPKPGASNNDVVKVAISDFIYFKSGDKKQVPVFKQTNSLVQVPTNSHGMRWVRISDVNLTVNKCLNARTSQTGGSGNGAVTAGAGSHHIICGG